MSNPDVATASMFERHLDQKKLSEAFDTGNR